MLIHPPIVQEIQRERQETARRERLGAELRANKPPRQRPSLVRFFRRNFTPTTAPQSR